MNDYSFIIRLTDSLDSIFFNKNIIITTQIKIVLKQYLILTEEYNIHLTFQSLILKYVSFFLFLIT